MRTLAACCATLLVVATACFEQRLGSSGDGEDAGASVDADPACSRGTYEGDLHANNRETLDSLQGYTAISGSLTIEACDTCVDLSALSCLRSVGRELTVDSNPTLTSVHGLENLTAVGDGNDWIYIRNNPALIELGLSGLTEVSLSVAIANNASLEHLTMFGNLSSVGELWIQGNQSLVDLAGLSNLSSVGDLRIESNPSLADLAGLSSSLSVGNLWIEGNASLATLHGLEGLTSLDRLGIVDNPSLKSLHGLEGLSLLKSVFVSRNPSLTSLDGFSGLTWILGHEGGYNGPCFPDPGTETSCGLDVHDNAALADCEVCALLEGLAAEPLYVSVDGNLDDTCTPAPYNCP